MPSSQLVCPFLSEGYHLWNNSTYAETVSGWSWRWTFKSLSPAPDKAISDMLYKLAQRHAQRSSVTIHVIGDSVAQDLFAALACQIYLKIGARIPKYHSEQRFELTFHGAALRLHMRFHRLDRIFEINDRQRNNSTRPLEVVLGNVTERDLIVVHVGLHYSKGKLGNRYAATFFEHLTWAMKCMSAFRVFWLSPTCVHYWGGDWNSGMPECAANVFDGPLRGIKGVPLLVRNTLESLEHGKALTQVGHINGADSVLTENIVQAVLRRSALVHALIENPAYATGAHMMLDALPIVLQRADAHGFSSKSRPYALKSTRRIKDPPRRADCTHYNLGGVMDVLARELLQSLHRHVHREE